MWKRSNCKNQRDEEESDNDEGDHLICSMRGTEWESPPYPISVDPGASASTFPKDWCQHVKLWETPESNVGRSFNAANGQATPNVGRGVVTLMAREGAIRDMKFEVCNVSRALGSVSQMRRVGHKVAFNPPGDPNARYMSHVETGQKLWMTEKDGIHVLDVRVARETQQSANSLDFAGQGQ